MLAIALISAGLVALKHRVHNASITRQRIDVLASNLAGELVKDMHIYVYGLMGMRGAVMALGPGALTRDAVDRYARARNIDVEFPGARGFGFIRRVPVTQEAAFLAAARRDGAPDFQIQELSPNRNERWVIQYIEPVARNRQALGLDIASEPSRRRAAEVAMQSGTPSLTRPITVLQAKQLAQSAFLLLLPVYGVSPASGKQGTDPASTVGWVYAPLVTREVLSSFNLRLERGTLTIDDVTPGEPPLRFHGPRDDVLARSTLSASLTRTLFGRSWRIGVHVGRPFVESLSLLSPVLTLLAGIVAALLASALTYLHALTQEREREIRAQQARLSALVENSSDAIVGVSIDGRLLSWNRAAEHLLGYAAADVLGQPLASLALCAGVTDCLFLPGGMSSAPMTPVERVLCDRDGHLVEAVVARSPITSAQGQVIGHGYTIHDIRDRKAGERRLHLQALELEEQVAERTKQLDAAQRDLRAILDAIPSLVGYWDKQCINRFANRAYADWFGVRPESLPGTHLSDLLGRELFERNRPHVEEALRGQTQSFEASVPTPDGSGLRRAHAYYLPDIVDGDVRGFYVLVNDVTEITESRQQLARVVRENAGLLRTLHSHALVSVTDSHGRIIDVNEGFCRISGYRREELIGQNHRLINSGTHPAGFWKSMWATVGRGVTWQGEVCNRAKDGSLYWVETTIAPFLGENEKIEKYVSIRTDITSRVQASAELARERQRLESILEGTHAGTWEWNVQTGEMRINERWAEVIGYTLDELAPLDVAGWKARIHPDDLVQSEALLERHFARTLSYYEHEYRMRHRDGHWIWVVDRGGVSTWTEHGEPEWMYGTQQEITASKEAQRRLAEGEAFLERAGRIARVGGFRIDLATKAIAWTREMRRLHDVPDDFSPTAESALLFIAVGERPAFQTALAEAVRTGVGFDLEVPLVSAQGRPFWARIAVEVERENGRPTQLVGALQDITAQRDAGEALRRAMIEAEAASAAKSAFLANTSHEIRTPLNAIIGLSYILAQTSLGDEQRNYVAKIQISGRTLLGVIDDVLDLSKIEAGELALEDLEFDFHALINDLIEMMNPSAMARQLELRLVGAFDVPRNLRGDVTRTRQVLVNLLSNAIKFTERGWVELSVSCVESERGQLTLRCAVKDTGIGISDEARTKLFRPFAQADATTTRRFGGTGLGLSIVQHLVRMMGGDIGLSSALGKGSEFWVELPFTVARANATEEKSCPPLSAEIVRLGSRAKESSEPLGLQLQGVRVLVVDDSDVNVEVAQRILEMEGAVVSTCSDGSQALDCLAQRAGDFDVVLMDIQMPGMDGNEVVRRARNELSLRALPIIALTAGALVVERQRALAAGMVDFVSKPLDPKMLVRTVRRHVRSVLSRPSISEPRLPTATEQAIAWPHVEGLDDDEARERLSGDVSFFVSTLGRVLREFAGLARPPLIDYEDRDACQTLARVLHKLRGSAGLLGAREIVRRSERAEMALLDDAGSADRLPSMVDLAAAIASLSRNAEPLLALHASTHADNDQGAPGPALDAVEVSSLLGLLANQDLAALAYVQARTGAFRATLGTSLFGQFSQHLDDLDFVAAASVLRRHTAA